MVLRASRPIDGTLQNCKCLIAVSTVPLRTRLPTQVGGISAVTKHVSVLPGRRQHRSTRCALCLRPRQPIHHLRPLVVYAGLSCAEPPLTPATCKDSLNIGLGDLGLSFSTDFNAAGSGGSGAGGAGAGGAGSGGYSAAGGASPAEPVAPDPPPGKSTTSPPLPASSADPPPKEQPTSDQSSADATAALIMAGRRLLRGPRVQKASCMERPGCWSDAQDESVNSL